MTASPNRAQRRACRAMAGATAAVLARHCHDHHAAQLVQVAVPAVQRPCADLSPRRCLRLLRRVQETGRTGKEGRLPLWTGDGG